MELKRYLTMHKESPTPPASKRRERQHHEDSVVGWDGTANERSVQAKRVIANGEKVLSHPTGTAVRCRYLLSMRRKEEFFNRSALPHPSFRMRRNVESFDLSTSPFSLFAAAIEEAITLC